MPVLESSPELRAHQVLLALSAALFAAGLGLGKIVRDCSLTCNVGFRFAPFAILAIAVVTVPLAAAAVRGQRLWGYRGWQVGSLVAGAVSLVAFRLLLHGLLRGQDLALAAGTAVPWPSALRWTYLSFYVWVGGLTALQGVNIYSQLVRLFGTGQLEKGVAVLAPAFALGGFAGSVAAGRAAPWLMSTLGWRYEVLRDNLMLAMAACLLAQIPVVLAIERRVIAEVAATRVITARVTWTRPVAVGRAIVWKLAVVIALGGVADTLLKYLFYWLVSLQVDYSPGRTLYFAAFYSWLNGANLVLLLAGTGRAIRRLGLALSVASLPLAMAAGAAALTLHLAMSLMYALRVSENSARSILYEPALDRTLVRIPPGSADRSRALLKALAPRGGEGLGALLVLGLGSWGGFDPRTAAATLLAVVLAWLGTALALRPALKEATGD